VSYTAEKLQENALEQLHTIQRLKPSSAKGIYMKTISVASTMSPGIQVDPKGV
jgi:large subunit ribosomal protein L1